LLIGATVEEKGFDPHLTAGGQLSLLEATWRALPGIEELPIDEMRYVEPGRLAFVSVAFHERSSPAYKAPSELRRRMRQLGSIEDSRSLDTVRVSGRFASRARYTTYFYARSRLLGETVSVFYTELIMVPDPRGVYLIRYQAARDEFRKHRGAYLSFLATFTLPETAAAPEEYYVNQDHIVQELLEEPAAPEKEETSGR